MEVGKQRAFLKLSSKLKLRCRCIHSTESRIDKFGFPLVDISYTLSQWSGSRRVLNCDESSRLSKGSSYMQAPPCHCGYWDWEWLWVSQWLTESLSVSDWLSRPDWDSISLFILQFKVQCGSSWLSGLRSRQIQSLMIDPLWLSTDRCTRLTLSHLLFQTSKSNTNSIYGHSPA